MKTRNEIVANARRMRTEIRQIFTDCEYWNDNARKIDEEKINPDPDGKLTLMAKALDEMLAREAEIARIK